MKHKEHKEAKFGVLLNTARRNYSQTPSRVELLLDDNGVSVIIQYLHAQPLRRRAGLDN